MNNPGAKRYHPMLGMTISFLAQNDGASLIKNIILVIISQVL